MSIRDWDIDRQSVYRYRAPVLLPAGTTLHMRFVYEPGGEPAQLAYATGAGARGEPVRRRVGHLWLQVLLVEATVQGKDARLLLEQAWMRNRLRKGVRRRDGALQLGGGGGLGGPQRGGGAAVPAHLCALDRGCTDADGARSGTGRCWAFAGGAKTYRRVLELQPEQNDAWFDLAQVELRHGQYAEAAGEFRALVERASNDAGAHAGLGAALMGQNQGRRPMWSLWRRWRSTRVCVRRSKERRRWS